MTDMIAIERSDGVVVLRINRPEKRNALTSDMYRALTVALDDASADDEVGAIMIVGSGGSFSAGNDLASFLEPRSGPFSDSPPARFMKALVRNVKPVVAAVDGVAVGIGFTMLLHCDLVFATSAARFRLPFVDLGIVPEAGSSRLLPDRVGLAVASDLLLTGRFLEAEEALALRLINRLVDASDLESLAFEQAQALAAKPRVALLKSRALIRGDVVGLTALIDHEFDVFGEALASPETQALIARMAKPRT